MEFTFIGEQEQFSFNPIDVSTPNISQAKTIIELGQKGIYIDGILKYCYTTTNNVSVGTVIDDKTLSEIL